MAYFRTKTLHHLMIIATCSTVLLISSCSYTHTTPQPVKKESLTNIFKRFTQPRVNNAHASALTGMWNCNDGGIHYIRQVGNQLWWYGQSSDGGKTWSNVFQGKIRGDRIIGNWADVPKGNIRGYGKITLKISGDRIQKISDVGDFGGSVWSR